jgi:hypothetical protein
MTDKNANTEIRKEFCPNCEAETPCTHEAELYVCDICGEDFAKYIVSRNCNVSDVSTTQDVTTPEPPEDALNARIAELEAENAELKERVAMLDVTAVFKSLGEMGHIEQVVRLNARIAELEEKHKVAFGLVRKLRMYCFNANWEYSDPEEADEFDEFDAEVCEYLSEYKEREE